jgi:dTDP-4-amino-4,6-dideoxygalactose transaminase
LSPEGGDEDRPAAHPTQGETGVVAELGEVLRAQIGQLVLLPMAPRNSTGLSSGAPIYKPSIGAEEINEVIAILKGGWLTTGPKTEQFEREFAEYLKHKHGVAVNSCTAALHLALEAIGLKADRGVIVPTMTLAATAEVARYFGARPILVDSALHSVSAREIPWRIAPA